jgi:hypothetical protein
LKAAGSFDFPTAASPSAGAAAASADKSDNREAALPKGEQ